MEICLISGKYLSGKVMFSLMEKSDVKFGEGHFMKRKQVD